MKLRENKLKMEKSERRRDVIKKKEKNKKQYGNWFMTKDETKTLDCDDDNSGIHNKRETLCRFFFHYFLFFF